MNLHYQYTHLALPLRLQSTLKRAFIIAAKNRVRLRTTMAPLVSKINLGISMKTKASQKADLCSKIQHVIKSGLRKKA